MHIRDRVKELRRVSGSALRPNPRNWRSHPPLQRDALRGVLAEVGFAGALLVRELSDGSLELIDGHLRAETLPDIEIPVLVLDVDEQEAAKLLALVDPLAGLAHAQTETLQELIDTIESDNAAIRQVLSELTAPSFTPHESPTESTAHATEPVEAYQVLVECQNEQEQQTIFERLTREGYQCRALTL